MRDTVEPVLGSPQWPYKYGLSSHVVFGDRFDYIEMQDHLPGIVGLSRQVLSYASGLSRQVLLYKGGHKNLSDGHIEYKQFH